MKTNTTMNASAIAQNETGVAVKKATAVRTLKSLKDKGKQNAIAKTKPVEQTWFKLVFEHSTWGTIRLVPTDAFPYLKTNSRGLKYFMRMAKKPEDSKAEALLKEEFSDFFDHLKELGFGIYWKSVDFAMIYDDEKFKKLKESEWFRTFIPTIPEVPQAVKDKAAAHNANAKKKAEDSALLKEAKAEKKKTAKKATTKKASASESSADDARLTTLETAVNAILTKLNEAPSAQPQSTDILETMAQMQAQNLQMMQAMMQTIQAMQKPKTTRKSKKAEAETEVAETK